MNNECFYYHLQIIYESIYINPASFYQTQLVCCDLRKLWIIFDKQSGIGKNCIANMKSLQFCQSFVCGHRL